MISQYFETVYISHCLLTKINKMSMGKCLPSKWSSPNMCSGKKKKKTTIWFWAPYSLCIFPPLQDPFFVSGIVLDAGATEVSKIGCLLSKSSHHLIDGQDRHSQLIVIIARTEVAIRTNSLRQEQWMDGEIQAPVCFSSASSYSVVGMWRAALAHWHWPSYTCSFPASHSWGFRHKSKDLKERG